MRIDHNLHIRIRDAYAASHEPEAVHMLGRIYWALLISLLALMVIGSVSYGVWQFLQPLEADVEPSVTVGARKGLNRAEIQKVLEGFDVRSSMYENRRVAPIPVKDPS